jgi:O-antigen/teichoic acid export membrane protein
VKNPAGMADVQQVTESAPAVLNRGAPTGRRTAAPAPHRELRGRIMKGALARLSGRAAGGVLSLVALHYATRYFGPRLWGPIVAATALFAVFSAIGDFGAGRITSREVARSEEGAGASVVYGTSLAVASLLGFGGAVFLVAFGMILYFDKGPTFEYVLVLAPAVVFVAWWQTSAAVLTGRERNDVRALLDVGSSALLLAGVFAVISAHLEGTGYVALAVGSIALTCAASLLLARQHLRARFSFRREAFVGFLKVSMPVGASLMLYALYLRIGIVLLSFFSGQRAVGAYGVAVQIAMFVMAAPGFLMGAVIAPFMRAGAEERNSLSQHALFILVSASLPIPVLLGLFGHAFVVMLSGSAFSGAVHPLVLLGVACTVWSVNAGLVDLLINVGAEGRLLRPLSVSAALSVVASLVAVPFFGMVGAAAVIIGTELLNLYQYSRLYHSLTGYVPDLRAAIPAVVATLVLAAAAETAVHVGGLRISHGPVLATQMVGALLVYLAAFAACDRGLKRLGDPGAAAHG